MSVAADRLLKEGRPSQSVVGELQRIERECVFTASGAPLFQNLLGRLGVDSSKAISIPEDDQPFWFRCDHQLKTYRSKPELPAEADVVIIGAGLTGASAAYHLREAARDGRRVIVLDKGSPACEASGRNGGNFELLPENSVGVYEGLERERMLFLRRCYPRLPKELLRIEAARQASLVLGFALRNRDLLKQIIEREKIDCDFSPKGWLYLAHTEKEEQGLCDEVLLAAEQGQRIEIWSRLKIREEFGFERRFLGRFIPGDGTYHPFKFVYSVLQTAVDAGVELYTGVQVKEVEDGEKIVVVTDNGRVMAEQVIVATNAFTRELFPELAAIRPAQSQIGITEFAPDRCRGRIVTSEEGPVYFNQPREGARKGLAPLLMGGGVDRSTKNPHSRRRSSKTHGLLLRLREQYFPELKQRPFSTEWVGPIAMTPDQLPAVGFLRPGIIIAAGYNGYGGSYCVAAGDAAATMAVTGEVPEWLSQDVFSPVRFALDDPMFLMQRDGLWRVAASLCRQLRVVDRQIAEAFSHGAQGRRRPAPFSKNGEASCDGAGASVGTDELRRLREFATLTRAEAQQLLGMVRRVDLSRGSVLFEQGSPGRSCFVIVRGEVDVTMQVRGQEQLLVRLQAGSMLGQVSLVEGGPRTATCTAHTDTVLLEMDREPCEKLFATRSALAYKFLTALVEGLIVALRGADRQLMRMTEHERGDRADAGERAQSAGVAAKKAVVS